MMLLNYTKVKETLSLTYEGCHQVLQHLKKSLFTWLEIILKGGDKFSINQQVPLNFPKLEY